VIPPPYLTGGVRRLRYQWQRARPMMVICGVISINSQTSAIKI
jgi:hypothetical protein